MAAPAARPKFNFNHVRDEDIPEAYKHFEDKDSSTGSSGAVQLYQHLKNKRYYAGKRLFREVDAKDAKAELAALRSIECARKRHGHSAFHVLGLASDVEQNVFRDGRLFMLETHPNVMTLLTWQAGDCVHEERVAMELMRMLMHGVLVLHDMRLTHRDLAPRNILVQLDPLDERRPPRNLWICDFGLAKVCDRMTTVGRGTPEFRAPEIDMRDSSSFYDKKCDIFSAGVNLLFMLTGRRFVEDVRIWRNWREDGTLEQNVLEAAAAARGALIQTQATAPSAEVRREIWELLASMLHKDPKSRPTAESVCNNKWVDPLAVIFRQVRARERARCLAGSPRPAE